jgi:AcrR family transcriptional regulator
MAPSDSASQSHMPLFPSLRGQPRRLSSEQIAEHQRMRLQGAMVEAVASHGFASTTVDELVGKAGVSKTAFYEQFENKQACFLSTFDEIIRQATERVGAAYGEPGDSRERLVAAVAAFMDLALAEPGAARLLTVESLILGTAGVEHRERGTEAFEAMVRQSFDDSPSAVEVSDVVVRVVVAGIRGVIYRQLRAGRLSELPGLVEPLVDWALSYQREPGEPVRQAMKAAKRAPRAQGKEDLSWKEPPDSQRSRAGLTQRERIIRAAAQAVVKDGYAALRTSAISAAAGVSNQTFYECFKGKDDAFLAAFEVVAGELLQVVGDAFLAAGDRPAAIGAGVRAMTDYFAEHELFARLAFFELTAAGGVALDRADRVLDDFGALLEPQVLPTGLEKPLPPEVLPAITSGVWAAIQHEIVRGRRESLSKLAPEIARIVVQPFEAS